MSAPDREAAYVIRVYGFRLVVAAFGVAFVLALTCLFGPVFW